MIFKIKLSILAVKLLTKNEKPTCLLTIHIASIYSLEACWIAVFFLCYHIEILPIQNLSMFLQTLGSTKPHRKNIKQKTWYSDKVTNYLSHIYTPYFDLISFLFKLQGAKPMAAESTRQHVWWSTTVKPASQHGVCWVHRWRQRCWQRPRLVGKSSQLRSW